MNLRLKREAMLRRIATLRLEAKKPWVRGLELKRIQERLVYWLRRFLEEISQPV